mmetsp:Transcript_1998/g.7231  ORF Transcript_1998/g.7231 Transcript_1998/m.7231 type:complete len:220 (-) Transcript_1998:333-992(-)
MITPFSYCGFRRCSRSSSNTVPSATSSALLFSAAASGELRRSLMTTGSEVRPRSFRMYSECVPLPEPGAPMRKILSSGNCIFSRPYLCSILFQTFWKMRSGSATSCSSVFSPSPFSLEAASWRAWAAFSSCFWSTASRAATEGAIVSVEDTDAVDFSLFPSHSGSPGTVGGWSGKRAVDFSLLLSPIGSMTATGAWREAEAVDFSLLHSPIASLADVSA